MCGAKKISIRAHYLYVHQAAFQLLLHDALNFFGSFDETESKRHAQLYPICGRLLIK